MIRITGAAFVAISVAGCSAAPGPAYMPSVTGPNCIALDQIAARRVGDSGSIYFQLADGVVFRNHLASACPGIEQFGGTAAMQVSSGGVGGQLCTGNRIRFEVEGSPECVLGDFTRMTPVSSN